MPSKYKAWMAMKPSVALGSQEKDIELESGNAESKAPGNVSDDGEEVAKAEGQESEKSKEVGSAVLDGKETSIAESQKSEKIS
jgi:hypothetical protein